jgi:chemotaxis protein methyltransferase CheR
MARFERANLLDEGAGTWRAEIFDVVFCRNMLMYLTPVAAARVVSSIAGRLSAGGFLFLGHAENLRGLSTDFRLVHSHGTFYYQRRDGVAPQAARRSPPTAAVSTETSWFESIARASRRIETLAQQTDAGTADSPALPDPGRPDLEPAMDLMKQERFHEALRLLAAEPPTPAEPDALLLRATLQVGTGELAAAERTCEELLSVDELNAGAHYLTAICREHLGDRAGAIDHSQTATYLDAEFAMPHLQLGRLARRAGDLATARRELDLAAGLLAREDAARIVLFGGGFSRAALIAVCHAELDACGGVP